MPYDNAEEILKLAIRMQGSWEGISLADIQEMFECGRRKAERLRDKVFHMFNEEPGNNEVPTGEKTKRWRLPAGTVNRLVRFTAEEMAALDGAIDLTRRENMTKRVDLLRDVQDKVRALMPKDQVRRIDPDWELLTEAEGLAMRPGPRPRIETSVVIPLREAMLRTREIRIRYRARETGKVSRNRLRPDGFLYGRGIFSWPGAWKPRGGACSACRASRRLSCGKRCSSATHPFPLRHLPRGLSACSRKSRSMSSGNSPRSCEDAREFLFHPTQIQEEQPDGSLIVRFHAGGRREMDWHLYTWGDAVEVIQPADENHPE